ncbi:stalk domain-containing protein [Anaerovorax odorimutans]|uniref:stalk domain-containing protein n=1 Tax=Anaerovorax odorimutans TaxID=109327 RepID=UPI0003FED905|nr:stalk domain-containing protein [Anaerovorax odorimutans]
MFTNKKIISLIIILVLSVTQITSFAMAKTDVSNIITETAKYSLENVKNPSLGSIGGEWAIIGLARSGYNVPESYYEDYYNSIIKELQQNNGELTKTKYTEYSRVILALTAIGKDVTDVGGYNLLEKLSDFENVKKQGINGPIFALIAFDSHEYNIPELKDVSTQNSRQTMIDYILSREITADNGVKGGFALTGNVVDSDLTAMVIQALAKYKDQDNVKEAISRAINVIDTIGKSNSESLAQIIVAKSALGIDASDNVSELIKYEAENGGFKHILSDKVNQMATEQSLYALVAYERYLHNSNSLYDMSDVKLNSSKETLPSSNEIKVLLNGKNINFDQPPVNLNNRVLVPMRGIFQELGAEVNWDSAEKKVTAALENNEIELYIGSETAYVNGTEYFLDVPASIISGRTMVPIRFIAQSLKAEVEWKDETKTVEITK